MIHTATVILVQCLVTGFSPSEGFEMSCTKRAFPIAIEAATPDHALAACYEKDGLELFNKIQTTARAHGQPLIEQFMKDYRAGKKPILPKGVAIFRPYSCEVDGAGRPQTSA